MVVKIISAIAVIGNLLIFCYCIWIISYYIANPIGIDDSEVFSIILFRYSIPTLLLSLLTALFSYKNIKIRSLTNGIVFNLLAFIYFIYITSIFNSIR